jgi:hypothetical protein
MKARRPYERRDQLQVLGGPLVSGVGITVPIANATFREQPLALFTRVMGPIITNWVDDVVGNFGLATPISRT